MLINQRVTAVIPARFGSTRFEGKLLQDLGGKPMFQHVVDRCKESRYFDEIIVATDDDRIRSAAEQFGGTVMMTSADHQSGTDRAAEVARQIETDLLAVVQGDEPTIRPGVIDETIDAFRDELTLNVSAAATPIHQSDEIKDPNVVKVVIDQSGHALYFSRLPIPFIRNGSTPVPHYKHLGLYVYRKEFLLRYSKWPQTPLEKSEKLEQLRICEMGDRIRVIITEYDSIGIDTPEDLEKARKLFLEGTAN